MRMLGDLLGEQTALIESDVTRRRTDQTRHRMRFHVFGHVEADQFDTELHRELTRDFGLAHAGRTGEQEVADRLVGIAEARSRHLDRRCERFDRLVLTEHDHLEIAFEIAQHIAIRCRHLLGRNARHAGDDQFDFRHVDDGFALVFRHQTLTRTGFIDDVDGLVRQQTVADVLDRQIHRGLDGFAGVFDFVVLFEARFQIR